jgi:hypothetical protein
LCREEALDISKKYSEVLAKTPSLSKVPLVGVVKEIAENAQADVKLGVAEFQSNYFNDRPLYWDQERAFYQYLGNRKLSIPFAKFLRPWELYNDYKSLGNRLKDKNIAGNLAGEGFTQGGLIVFAPGDDDEALYKYEEVTGKEFPVEDFELGLQKLAEIVQAHE